MLVTEFICYSTVPWWNMYICQIFIYTLDSPITYVCLLVLLQYTNVMQYYSASELVHILPYKMFCGKCFVTVHLPLVFQKRTQITIHNCLEAFLIISSHKKILNSCLRLLDLMEFCFVSFFLQNKDLRRLNNLEKYIKKS